MFCNGHGYRLPVPVDGSGQRRPQGLLAFQFGKREDPGDEVGQR